MPSHGFAEVVSEAKKKLHRKMQFTLLIFNND